MANEAFSLKSAFVRWAGWATVTYGRVGKLKTRVGKRKKIFREFCPPWTETLPAPLDTPRSRTYDFLSVIHISRQFVAYRFSNGTAISLKKLFLLSGYPTPHWGLPSEFSNAF